ncbi:N-acetylmuramoyl-L-alanine amidase family protein [Aurantiacibacter rhizosphaerae]|uniref:N-acetylmuramoyl-L-alanine amidase n=1 Tax=Aurantiacibacter rhizosphaerae TaxID=2691582 RepID=A0A844XD26_9SPHN|nr:N-acetylmuramoyl-L-alanine amidase [Aurantiacibacter rhizosphaerae]MWV27886.1 N-acetylmuramoyl-L-alanine amidase [Aurantiacibacter rhizosphaerae]
MSYRVQIGLLFALPVLLVGALYAVGASIPVPVMGRDYVVRVALPDGSATIGLPEISGPSDPTRPLIVIDAGHGGPDLGAVNENYREKTIVLGLAQALRDRLLEEGGIRVAMTRDDDSFIVLEERAEIARAMGADLFLSIHADSAGDSEGVTGATIYTLSETASSEAAARFAERENNADVLNGVDLSGQDMAVNAILVELSQRRTSDRSGQFARLIEREGQGTLQFRPEPRRSASLAVLRAPDVPGVLYESGYITNLEDAQRLASPAGRERFADVMARAIRIYFARQSLES